MAPSSKDEERAGLLSDQEIKDNITVQEYIPTHSTCKHPNFNLAHLAAAFLSGILACLLIQISAHLSRKSEETSSSSSLTALAPPWAGSTQSHKFPPSHPTNAHPELFPSHVGYAGATPTGGEPAVIATAPSYPFHTGAAQLILPDSLPQGKNGTTSDSFNLLRSWGNLSPYYSVEPGVFGLDTDPDPPATCRVTGLHYLHRHGARYPTSYASYGGPANFATKLHENAEHWNSAGPLSFLENWTYQLGEEVLTPFGRHQLYDLGIGLRMKYGFLLQNFTKQQVLPVFRTESQDRMLSSALNFAIGFFGYPFDGQYQQSITIEADGFNNTLAPYKTCPNSNVNTKSDRGRDYTEKWTEIYLQEALERLTPFLPGLNLTIEDVYTMQQMCPYETVALGYSKFCELFTEDEWRGFDYALDLSFWYNNAFGSPLGRVLGIGYVQELVARLTHTPIQTHNSSTNGTLDDNSITFPLDHALYVDATHEVVVLNIITALNLTTFAAGGPLPADHIPENHPFKVNRLAPFATNMQFQLLDCDGEGPQIRIIINDGVAPLTGIKGCPDNKDGMCPLDTFIAAQKEIIGATDWIHDCHGDWEIPEGWSTTTGDAPR